MTNNKTTKRALLGSVVAMILCCTMLLGTTFAWFTDTVSTGNNIIKSGTLDVELYHVKEDAEVNVGDNKDYKVFDYDKWEPGYTKVETLKVTNEGNLAFKFSVIPNIPTTTSDDDQTGASLADVIDVYVYPGESTATSWENVRDTWKYAGNLASVLADPDGMAWGVILPVDENGEALDGVMPENQPAWLSVGESVMSVALHMREEAGNEYQNLDLGDLYLTLEATQFTYEEDSFDHLYDEMAGEDDWIYVYTGEQLNTALELDYDAKIKVMRDINLVECADIENTMLLDLNGYTILDELEGSESAWIRKTGGLTITGNGKWIKSDHGENMFYTDAPLTIMNGYFAYTAYNYGLECGHEGAAHCTNVQKLGCMIVGRGGEEYNGVVTIYDGIYDTGVQNPEAITAKSKNDGTNDDNMFALFNSHEGKKFKLTIYGGKFFIADPAGGDANGPVLFLEGQTERYVVPEGYVITKEVPGAGATDPRAYYIVTYNK